MIKGFRFVTRREDVTAEAFAAEWPGAVAAAMQAPPEVRPTRLAVCTVLPESDPGPRHDGVEIGWFDDGPHLRRFRGWVGTSRGWSVLKGLDRVVDFDASPVVVAKETAPRGADWLGHRWRDGGARFKHMAVAVRAEGLTPAEFAERWRAHAGQVRTRGRLLRVEPIRHHRGRLRLHGCGLGRGHGRLPGDGGRADGRQRLPEGGGVEDHGGLQEGRAASTAMGSPIAARMPAARPPASSGFQGVVSHPVRGPW